MEVVPALSPTSTGASVGCLLSGVTETPTFGTSQPGRLGTNFIILVYRKSLDDQFIHFSYYLE